MTEHNFDALIEHYPALIAEMPNPFTSREFILHLARHHQTLYIEALYAYRNLPNRQSPTPFKTVHAILARRLTAYPKLIKYVGDIKSENIFDYENECAQWRKV